VQRLIKRSEKSQNAQAILKDSAGEEYVLAKTFTDTVGCIKQLSELSSYATEIFSEIIVLSSTIHKRIGSLNARTIKLQTDLPTLKVDKTAFNIHDDEYQHHRQMLQDPQSEHLVDHTSLPNSMEARYCSEEVKPRIRFDGLDEYQSYFPLGNKTSNIAERYSYPEYFLNQWCTAQVERMKQLEKEKKRNRADKKIRKKQRVAEAAIEQQRKPKRRSSVNWQERYMVDGKAVHRKSVNDTGTRGKRLSAMAPAVINKPEERDEDEQDEEDASEPGTPAKPSPNSRRTSQLRPGTSIRSGTVRYSAVYGSKSTKTFSAGRPEDYDDDEGDNEADEEPENSPAVESSSHYSPTTRTPDAESSAQDSTVSPVSFQPVSSKTKPDATVEPSAPPEPPHEATAPAPATLVKAMQSLSAGPPATAFPPNKPPPPSTHATVTSTEDFATATGAKGLVPPPPPSSGSSMAPQPPPPPVPSQNHPPPPPITAKEVELPSSHSVKSATSADMIGTPLSFRSNQTKASGSEETDSEPDEEGEEEERQSMCIPLAVPSKPTYLEDMLSKATNLIGVRPVARPPPPPPPPPKEAITPSTVNGDGSATPGKNLLKPRPPSDQCSTPRSILSAISNRNSMARSRFSVRGSGGGARTASTDSVSSQLSGYPFLGGSVPPLNFEAATEKEEEEEIDHFAAVTSGDEASNKPAPPPPPPPPGAAGPAAGGGLPKLSFLDSIKAGAGGAGLRKTSTEDSPQPPAAPMKGSSNSRASLLDAIKLGGVNLRRVTEEEQSAAQEEKKQRGSVGGFGASSVAAILERRKFLMAEESDSDSDKDDGEWA